MSMQKCEKTWESEIIEHKGFRDLGNYVIELPDVTDPGTRERGRITGNKIADNGGLPPFGCTSMVKRNSKGEVVIGRNMDLDISQSPAYVFKTTFGKYQNFCVSYSPGFYLSYEEVQKLDDIDPDMKDMMIYSACDCMNEKGLYIEVNLREKNEMLTCYGLHSSHGETHRDDGTPWSELRACTTGVCQHVSQNCATVKEAIEFLNNSYDWYTITPPPGVSMAVSENNLCYLIGDATGEYGVIEFGQDEISYLPYQYGQANYYITPKWNALDAWGAGVGRLAMVSKVIGPVETLEDAMDAMKPIMWRNETLWIGESERRADKHHPNPYNQIIFQDDQGNPQMDWRGEYIHLWPVMDDGRLLVDARLYEEAEKSTYDPMMKKYYDDAIATGRLVVDDGSYKFNVNGKEVNLTELSGKYDEYEACADPDRRAELKPYHEEYWRLLTNLTNYWVHNDYNYEAIKAVAYASLHTRRDKDGKFDPSCMSQYEKLRTFYGYGVEKDEKPLRDDATIWTTSLNVGANCAQKEIKIRFWENDNVIFHAKF
ncbi:MAG: linear amide C-N hydrolase [Lachnospiraceae bacterium]|nr:linear amide C-N hydrolase [Lachnospiraceae bacterium]